MVLLQGVDRSLADALATLERDGPNVIGLLGNAAETFADQAAISESMRDLHARLVAECPPLDGAVPDTISALTEKLWSAYTMDAERRVHEQLLGKRSTAKLSGVEPAADSDSAAEPNQTADDGEDDLDALFF